MKSNSWGNLLFNPFNRIAGWQAFFIGLGIVILSGIFGGLTNTWYTGLFDMSTGALPFRSGFMMLGIDIATIVVVMSLAALIVAKDFRFIDILGTMTLARAPMIILPLLELFLNADSAFHTSADPTSSPSVIILKILGYPIVLWHIVLIYNGLRTSANLNGAKLIVTAIITIVISEMLSQYLVKTAIANLVVPYI